MQNNNKNTRCGKKESCRQTDKGGALGCRQTRGRRYQKKCTTQSLGRSCKSCKYGEWKFANKAGTKSWAITVAKGTVGNMPKAIHHYFSHHLSGFKQLVLGHQLMKAVFSWRTNYAGK